MSDVANELRRLIDTYGRPDGGLILGLGNGYTEDIPLSKMEELFREAESLAMDKP